MTDPASTLAEKLRASGASDIDLTDDEVVALVISWAQARRPSALVRFGEGEGRLLAARIEDEDSLRVATNKVRRQAGIELGTMEVLDLKVRILRAFDEADVVGIRGSDWFNEEHAMWVARIEEVFAQRREHRRNPSFVAHCLVGGKLREALAELLNPLGMVSVVSSRDLEGLLRNDYGADTKIYPIPSQYVMRNVDGEYESRLHEVPIWPDFFGQLRRSIVVREKGEVFLVGAGLFGKDLCIDIKEKGGIALDMGSSLDGLAGKVTRGRHKPAAWTGPPKEARKASPTPEVRAVLDATVEKFPFLEDSGWIRSHASKASVDSKGNPMPRYSYAAIDFLTERVDSSHNVFAFGCGNSTLWWAQRVASITAVEHDSETKKQISEIAPDGVSILAMALESDGRYCRVPQTLARTFDIVVIDGEDRANCAAQCLPALAPSGVIVFNDSQRRLNRPGVRFLTRRGFKRIRFTGLGPISPERTETSIFYRSNNCLDI